jgi:Protein of unknown function (DUF2442)
VPRLLSVHSLDGFRLAARFDDGTSGEIALRERLFGPVFDPLRDPDDFARAFVDEFGAVAWPNGADLAPDALYAELRESATVESRG